MMKNQKLKIIRNKSWGNQLGLESEPECVGPASVSDYAVTKQEYTKTEYSKAFFNFNLAKEPTTLIQKLCYSFWLLFSFKKSWLKGFPVFAILQSFVFLWIFFRCQYAKSN